MKKTDLYLKFGTYVKASSADGDIQGISLENFVVSVLNNPTCCPKPPGSPNGMLMTALALYPTLQTVTDFLGNSSAIQLSTLRLGVKSDSSVTTQTSSVIQSTTTNANLVIAPNGTGALVANIPDGTATGGNARGANAVDFQMSRYNNAQVASGANSFVGGGANNRATGVTSACAGGDNNFANGLRSFVGAGLNNSATGSESVIVGGNGNAASGTQSLSGGSLNTASGVQSIALGSGQVANNAQSVCIGLGPSTASGQASVVLGYGNHATEFGSMALCNGSMSYLTSQVSIASGTFSGFPGERGEAQQSLLTARRLASLNSGATAVLSLNGTGVTNLLIPNGNNRLWAVKVFATAFVSVAGGTLVLGDSYMGEYTLLFKKVGGVSSVVGVNAGNIIYDTNMVTAAFTFAAGASQDLQITFKAPTTASATTFRCVARVELTEVAY